jgi:hypothetical protein
MRPTKAAAPLLLAVAVLMGVVPAGAHDGDHSGPGSTGPDRHSKNVKLLSNVPRSAAATQSDLAFDGKLAYAGNYVGFRVLDVSDPEAPVVISDFRCNGAQGDVSVYGGLLFQSVDTPQSSGACNSTNVSGTTPGAWEGVRIFDVSNPADPVHVASVATDCGSHTHTLVPDEATDSVLVYVSSYPLSGLGPNCQRPHGFVSIIDVPLAAPQAATVLKDFLSPATEIANFSTLGAQFVACHDISVFVELGLAAGACMSEAQLWDISDPRDPSLLWSFDHPVVNNSNIDLWHSAMFSWDGDIVAFGDESGGGGAARCTNPNDLQGRIWFLDTETGELLSNYKIPRSEAGVCTMHNFNFIPRRDGKHVLVSSAYTGGTTVIDVDALNAGASEAAAEVGFYRPSGGSAWSSYWYNGFIYANDIARGVDIFLLSDKARAGAKKLDMLNPQTQISTIG